MAKSANATPLPIIEEPTKPRKRASSGGAESERGLSAFELVQLLDQPWQGLNAYEQACWDRLRTDHSPEAVCEFLRCLYLRLLGRAASAPDDSQVAAHLQPLIDARAVKFSYGIIHDADERPHWNADKGCQVTENKPDHIHHLFALHGQDKRMTVEAVASALGFPEQQFNKPKRGRFALDNMTAYQIHAASPGKHEYKPQQVATLRTVEVSPTEPAMEVTAEALDYMNVYAVNGERWAKAKAKNKRKKMLTDGDLDRLYERVCWGEVSRESILLDDDLYAVMQLNRAKIDEGFHLAAERRAAKAIDALQRGEYKCEVIFITGEPGSGKSRAAFALAHALKEVSAASGGQPWDYYVAAATNPLDDYLGQEIIIMDDVRGQTLTAADWAKFLDPNYSAENRISARYKNARMAARVVIITCCETPTSFFAYTKGIGGGDRSEPIDQFLRRLNALVRVYSPSEVGQVIEQESRYQVGRRVKLDAPQQLVIGSSPMRINYGFEMDTPVLSPTDALLQMLDLVAEGSPQLADAVARYSLMHGAQPALPVAAVAIADVFPDATAAT